MRIKTWHCVYPTRWSFLGLLWLLHATLLAQTASVEAPAPGSAAAFWAGFNTPEKILAALCVVIIIGGFWAVIHLNSTLMHLQKIRILEKYSPEILEAMKIDTTVVRESFWSRLYKRWTKTVPLEEEGDIMLDHNYDGIQELDNSLPPWWLAVMYASIVFGVAYMGIMHFSSYGVSSAERYAREMEVAAEEVEAYLAGQANAVDESNVTVLADAGDLDMGKVIFDGKCFACHGAFGEGGIGPNLTDEYWMHGGSIADIFTTVKYGVVEKGMQAWNKDLSPYQMQQVSSYILTLQGTNPPNAKAAEGELYIEEVEEQLDETAPETDEPAEVLTIESSAG